MTALSVPLVRAELVSRMRTLELTDAMPVVAAVGFVNVLSGLSTRVGLVAFALLGLVCVVVAQSRSPRTLPISSRERKFAHGIIAILQYGLSTSACLLVRVGMPLSDAAPVGASAVAAGAVLGAIHLAASAEREDRTVASVLSLMLGGALAYAVDASTLATVVLMAVAVVIAHMLPSRMDGLTIPAWSKAWRQRFVYGPPRPGLVFVASVFLTTVVTLPQTLWFAGSASSVKLSVSYGMLAGIAASAPLVAHSRVVGLHLPVHPRSMVHTSLLTTSAALAGIVFPTVIAGTFAGFDVSLALLSAVLWASIPTSGRLLGTVSPDAHTMNMVVTGLVAVSWGWAYTMILINVDAGVPVLSTLLRGVVFNVVVIVAYVVVQLRTLPPRPA